MAEITTVIQQFNADETPLLTDPSNFSQYTDNYHLKLNSVIPSINTWATEANSLRTEVNNSRDTSVTSANTATTKASEASTSASQALAYKNEAQTARDEAVAIYDNFDDRYLGSKVSEPTLDNDGNPLVSGTLYYNTSSNSMYVYDSILAQWIDIAYVPTLLSGLSDVVFGGLTDEDILVYNSTTSKWENKPKDYYIKSEADKFLSDSINALAPNSGYTRVSKKLDNFVFEESSSFLNKVADKNRFVKFGEKIIDTYTHSSYDATKGGVVVQFQVPEVAEIVDEASGVTTVLVTAGNYVIQSKTTSTDHTSTTFRAKQDAPIGTALTNTTYFEDRTEIGVTNQQLAYHAYNTLTNSYEGIKTEVLFSDVSKEDLLDNPTWLARNGFSKVSQYLYSKDSYNDLVSGQYTTLNKGLFHPMLNVMGTRKASDDKYWYDTTVSFTSVADCFNESKLLLASGNVASGKSGRPIGDETPYYDVCYPSLYQDVREYAKLLTRDEVELIRADKEENGVDEVVVMLNAVNGALVSASESTAVTISGVSIDRTVLVFPASVGSFEDDVDYEFGRGWLSGNTQRHEVVRWDISGSTTYVQVLGAVASDFTLSNSYAGSRTTTKPILTSNTKLSIDLIGNPTNYPQVLKDRLASGVGIVGVNPLLVEA